MTENIKITRESFTAAMEAAVAERGEDFIYPAEWKAPFNKDKPEQGTRCLYYVPEVGAACIIGLTLEKLGVDVAAIAPNKNADYLLGEELGVKDNGLIWAAISAQRFQDQGSTWGHALEKYHETLASTNA